MYQSPCCYYNGPLRCGFNVPIKGLTVIKWHNSCQWLETDAWRTKLQTVHCDYKSCQGTDVTRVQNMIYTATSSQSRHTTVGGQPLSDRTPLDRIYLRFFLPQDPAGNYLKLVQVCISDPIRYTRRNPDPNRPSCVSKERELWPGRLSWGGLLVGRRTIYTWPDWDS